MRKGQSTDKHDWLVDVFRDDKGNGITDLAREPKPPPAPKADPETTDSAMRAALTRIPSKIVGAGLVGPPHVNPNCRSVYLTVAGIPLTLPAFSSANCAATADLIDAGTFGLHLP